MTMSRKEREKWQRLQRELIEGMRRVGMGLRPFVAEVNRAAAKFVDATWPLRYADDICESHGEVEDVFV